MGLLTSIGKCINSKLGTYLPSVIGPGSRVASGASLAGGVGVRAAIAYEGYELMRPLADKLDHYLQGQSEGYKHFDERFKSLENKLQQKIDVYFQVDGKTIAKATADENSRQARRESRASNGTYDFWALPALLGTSTGH